MFSFLVNQLLTSVKARQKETRSIPRDIPPPSSAGERSTILTRDAKLLHDFKVNLNRGLFGLNWWKNTDPG